MRPSGERRMNGTWTIGVTSNLNYEPEYEPDNEPDFGPDPTDDDTGTGVMAPYQMEFDPL